MAGLTFRVTVGAAPNQPLAGAASDLIGATDSAGWVLAGARSVGDPVGLTDAATAVLTPSSGFGASFGTSFGG